MVLAAGQELNDRYKLIERLGAGGFSVVWLAEDTYTDTQVAIKIFAPDKGLDQNGLAQFRKEFKRTRNLRHPHLLVPDHFDVLEGAQSPFLIMLYCPGGSLTDQAFQDGGLSEQQLATLIVQIGSGLSELHQKNIIHQDIKPDNILIGESGKYLLTDFGISRQMRSTLKKATANQSYMTVAYSPPERYSATPVDTPASDIFSLGVMLYELASGQLPWDGAGGMVLNTGAQVPNLPDAYSGRLNSIIRSCMHKDYQLRPTAGQLVEVGEAFLTEGAWPEVPAPSKPEADQPHIQPESPARKTQKMDHYPSQQKTAPAAKTKTAYPPGRTRRRSRSRYLSIGVIAIFVSLLAASIYFTIKPFGSDGTSAGTSTDIDADALLQEARLQMEEENLISEDQESAILFIDSLLAADPDNAEALALKDSLKSNLLQKGTQQIENKQFEEASLLYEDGLRIWPKDPELLKGKKEANEQWALSAPEFSLSHGYHIMATGFTPEGHLFSAGGNTIKLWDYNSGEVIKEVNYTNDVLVDMNMSPDGHFLGYREEITAPNGYSKLYRLVVKDLNNGIYYSEQPRRNRRDTDFDIASEKPYLVHTKEGANRVGVWNLQTRKQINSFPGTEHVIIARSGEEVAIFDDTSIIIREVQSGSMIRRINSGSEIREATFSNSGQWLIATDRNRLKVWEVDTGNLLTDQSLNPSFSVTGLALTADDSYLAISDWNKTIKLFRTSDWQRIRTYRDEMGAVRDVTFSPDGKYVINGSYDNSLKGWRTFIDD